MRKFIRERKQETKENLNVSIEPIDSVNLWKENPRKNSQSPSNLGKLLMLYGQVSPVVVWIKNKVIYKGNTTWKSLDWWRKLDDNEYKMILDDLKLPSTLQKPTTIKVLWQDFKNEEDAVSYGIADNKSSEWTFWDEKRLESLLAQYYLDLEKLTIRKDTTPTGFTMSELNNLILIPNLDNLKKKEGTKESEIIKIKCPPEIKDDLKEWLMENLDDHCPFIGLHTIEIV